MFYKVAILAFGFCVGNFLWVGIKSTLGLPGVEEKLTSDYTVAIERSFFQIIAVFATYYFFKV